MTFGIGFVLGGLSTGVTVAHWSGIVKTVQTWIAKIRAAIQRKAEARIAALKSKL